MLRRSTCRRCVITSGVACCMSRTAPSVDTALYRPEAINVLRVIKAAQRMGFTLDEVADLLEVSALRPGRRSDAGLQARARAKLTEVDAKLAELTTVRDNLRAALEAGCDDLITCADNPCCPVPSRRPSRWVYPMPRTRGRTARKWGLSAIGLAAVGCVGCCALPLLAAGGVLAGGAAMVSDPCFTPVWIVLLGVGVVGLAAWVIRSRSTRLCADVGDCGCVSGSESTDLSLSMTEDRSSAR